MTRTRRPVITTLLVALLTLGGATGAVTLGALPAQAHAGLTGSNPEDGATLTELPDEVVLTFGDAVAKPVTVIVTDPEGTGLQTGDARVAGTEVSQEIEPGQTAGLHTIAYRVISSDGHPITGQVRFTLEGDGSTDAPDAVLEETPADDLDASDGTWSVSYLVAGGILLGLVLVLVVGALVARTMRGQRETR